MPDARGYEPPKAEVGGLGGIPGPASPFLTDPLSWGDWPYRGDNTDNAIAPERMYTPEGQLVVPAGFPWPKAELDQLVPESRLHSPYPTGGVIPAAEVEVEVEPEPVTAKKTPAKTRQRKVPENRKA